MSQLIEFTEEQSMMLESAMDFCQTESPISKVREQIADSLSFDEIQWQKMSELGWLSVSIPEAHGGLGLGLADVVPIIESMGRQLTVSPFLTTTLTAQALIQGGSEEQKTTWLPKIAAGAIATLALVEEDGDWNLLNPSVTASISGDSLTLKGTKTFVLDAAQAELIIVSLMLDGKPQLVCVEISAIDKANIFNEVVIDETRRSYRICFDEVTVSKSAVLAKACFKQIENAALLLLSAEMAGGIAGVLNTIVEYLTTRQQFGRMIGSYQALKHPTVEILIGMEEARSLIYHAATIFEGGDEKEVEIALRMAKASVSKSFAFAGDRAVQFHGGFGFTYDCDAQLYLRRALWSQYQYGDEKHHRQILAPLLLD